MTRTYKGSLSQDVFKELAITTYNVRVKREESGMPDLPTIPDLQRSICVGEVDEGLPAFRDRVFAMMKAYINNSEGELENLRAGELEFTRDYILLMLNNEEFLCSLEIDDLYTERSKKAIALSLDSYHIWWNGLKNQGAEIKHPIAPFIQAWFKRKPDKAPQEYGAGFIPTRLAAHNRTHRRFGLPARIEERQSEQVVMPGFGSDRRMPALPVELLRLGEVSSKGGGRGANLALRATLAGIEFAPPYSRNSYYKMPVRDFLNRIYDNHIPSTRRWNAALRQVRQAQAAAEVPYIDPDTGRSGTVTPVYLGYIPGDLDGNVRILVDLPPKSNQGAPITDTLYYYGRRSSLAFFAMLQLTVDWWQPGKTRVPASRRRGVWVQLADKEKRAHIERYAPFDRDDMIALTTPFTTRKNKPDAYSNAVATLKRLQEAGELILLPDGRDTWRILPSIAE